MPDRIGLCILAGGKSERMGRDKADLYIGDVTFLERISKELSFIDEKMISLRKGDTRTLKDYVSVYDDGDKGPIGGIISALVNTKCDAVLFVPVDLPYYGKTDAENLINSYGGQCAFFPRDKENVHYVCGIIAKKALSYILKMEKEGKYAIRNLAALCETGYFEVCNSKAFVNINLPEEYDGIKLK